MNWDFLHRHRVRTGPYASNVFDGFNGAFTFPLEGEARRILCIASNGGGWDHVSVSLGPLAHKTPSWEIMVRVKELFWEPGDWVVQFMVPASENISLHPGSLHLWRCTDGREQPVPPKEFV